jgi:hypothetical protein
MAPLRLNMGKNASRELVQGYALCSFSRTNDLVSRTRHSVPSAVRGRAWTKNRENNPMQSRADPGSQHSCCAASGAGEEKGPNLISSRSQGVNHKTRGVGERPLRCAYRTRVGHCAMSEKCRYCCKSLFARWDSNSPARRCSDRIMMWGTTSPSAKLTGDSSSAFEALLIGDCRLFRSLAEN